VSTGILDEYEEKPSQFYSLQTAHLILEILCTADNVIFTEPSFRWNLITEDPDDNKFADLAISSNADALVTFDRHFDIFNNISFPNVTVLKPIEFEKLFT
jgi:predicted nucleic acid-binding protein